MTLTVLLQLFLMIVLILIILLSLQKISIAMARYGWVGALHHSDNSATELQSAVGRYILDWNKIKKKKGLDFPECSSL